MHLEVKGISFGYTAERKIFSDISFTYDSPEIMCILGANGTGKSTLLNCILARNEIQEGEVLVDGKKITNYKPPELARKIAYLPQSHMPSFAFPVLDVVMMGSTSRIGYFASPGKAEAELAREKLRFLNIEYLAEKPYTAISGGERQLVMIAAALAQEPELVVMDEPTSHLDFGNQFKFVNLVKQLQAEGIGVLMTTHFPDHALFLGCTTAILDRGGIAAVGRAADVITDDSMSRLYKIDINVTEVDGKRICVPLSC